jgi:GDP-4-dehydro-6-deoxy-D-mannose reductase
MITRPRTISSNRASPSFSRKPVKRQKALITGASGFTGRHLVVHLNSQGVETSSKGLRRGQIANPKILTETLEEAQPDYVFHLAGVSSGESAEEYFRSNVLYAVTLLRALRDASLDDRPVLFVGSGAEYGRVDDKDLPITEKTKCRPYNYYGMSKLMQTLIGLSAAEAGNYRIVVARPFNIVGTGMPEHLALSSFAQQIREIKAGKQPPVIEVGNLTSHRDFIDIEDVVQLYWAIIQNPKAYGEVFNLCTGIATSMEAVLARLIDISGLSIDIRIDPKKWKEVDIPVHYGSNRKLHQLTGEFKYTPLEATLRKIAQ